MFPLKDPLEEKSRAGIIYRYTCSKCRLLIMGKPSATFAPEQPNTCGSPILQENASKMLSGLQYLTIYCSVIEP